MNNEQKEWIPLATAAERLAESGVDGVTPRTLGRWVREGFRAENGFVKLPALKPRRNILVNIEDVYAFLKKRAAEEVRGPYGGRRQKQTRRGSSKQSKTVARQVLERFGIQCPGSR